MDNILGYIALGAIWAWWLESYTTKNLEGIYGSAWSTKERIFHIVFWPINLAIFIYNFIKGIW